jgi:L-alanine-DL-glutamate epimerase-like enolase superfamily enzyme
VKIKDVIVDEFWVKDYTLRDAEGHRHPGPQKDSAAFMVRIIADNGAEGVNFSSTHLLKPNDKYNIPKSAKDYSGGSGFSAAEIIRSVIKPMIVGEDALAREKIFQMIKERQRLNKAINETVLSYVDCALWDLAGNIAGLPVYKMLGGHRTKIKAYASTMVGDDYEGGLRSVEDYANYAVELKKQGFTAYKLHTWANVMWNENSWRGNADWKRDAEVCHAVRAAVGDDMELMLDPYHYYDRYDALKLGRELEKARFAWFEEPMDEYNVSSYKWLCDNLDIPVCGPEVALGKLHTRAEWIVSGACDICRTGAGDVGGLTPSIKVAHVCEAFGVPLEVHSPGPAAIHLLASSIVRGEYYEYGLIHPFLDWAAPPHLNSSIDEYDGAGNILVPQRPGLGWDINHDYIRDNLIRK